MVKNSRSSSSQGASSSSSSSDRHDTAKKSRKNGQIPISFLDCEVPDEVIFLDPHGGNKFYAEVAVKGITVKLGDFVRATLEADSYQKFSTAICQVLAIFDDVEKGLGVFIEVRWLVRVAELTEKKRKTLEQRIGHSPFKSNELIEGDQLDDIPVGSVSQKVRVIGYDDLSEYAGKKKERDADEESSFSKKESFQISEAEDIRTSVYVSRFLESSGSSSFQIVRNQSIFKRGIDLSHYQDAYANLTGYLDTSDGGIPTDIYSRAIRKLHISVLPDHLPCRVQERAKIQSLIRDALVQGDVGHAIYISGMPGTGKTATVLATMKCLVEEAKMGTIPDFQFVEINCLRISQPVEAYTVLWRALSGEFSSAKVALKQLTEFFAKQDEHHFSNSKLKTESRGIACLLDELDFLITADEQVVYNFFNWSMQKGCKLLIIGVSNIMDLPERLSHRMSSRIKSHLRRIVFAPYEHAQVKEILLHRLGELELKIFNRQTVEFLARKASTVAGDVRAALKICQRAIELYLEEQSALKKQHANDVAKWTLSQTQPQLNPKLKSKSKKKSKSVKKEDAMKEDEIKEDETNEDEMDPKPVPPPGIDGGITNNIVKKAADEYKENPMIATMRRACLLDKRILAAACKHVRLTGDSDMGVGMLWNRLCDFTSAVEAGRRASGYTGRVSVIPSMSTFYDAVQRLLGQGILISSKGLRGQRVREATGILNLTIRLRSEMTDVSQAIKGDENLFLHYHMVD